MQKAYKEMFVKRTQQLRERNTEFSQSDMARHLDVPVATYQKWEIRTPMPHYYLERFCHIVKTDIHYLVTGRQLKRSQTVSNDKVVTAFPNRQN